MNLMDLLRTLGVVSGPSPQPGYGVVGATPDPSGQMVPPNLAGTQPTPGAGLATQPDLASAAGALGGLASGDVGTASAGPAPVSYDQPLTQPAPGTLGGPPAIGRLSQLMADQGAPPRDYGPPAHALGGDPNTAAGRLNWGQMASLVGATLKDLGEIGLGQEGNHFDTALSGFRSQNAAEAIRAARSGVAQQMGFNPLQAFEYAYDPDAAKAFGTASADAMKPQIVGENGMLVRPGLPPVYNTGTRQVGDISVYQSGPHAGGMVPGSDVPQTPTERAALGNAGAHNIEADAASLRARADWQDAITRGKAEARPDEDLVGLNADGHAIYHDRRSGQERIGDVPVFGKPSASSSAFQQKLKALTDAGYSEQQAATMAAGGAKPMTAQQIAEIAEKAATAREGGMETDAATHAADVADVSRSLNAASFAPPATPPPGAGGGGAPSGGQPPKAALDVIGRGQQQAFANGQVWARDMNGQVHRVR